MQTILFIPAVTILTGHVSCEKHEALFIGILSKILIHIRYWDGRIQEVRQKKNVQHCPAGEG